MRLSLDEQNAVYAFKVRFVYSENDHDAVDHLVATCRTGCQGLHRDYINYIMANDLHLGSVCGHNLGSNWPYPVFSGDTRFD